MEVFLTNPWVPREWIVAHGLTPRGAWSAAGDHPASVGEGACAFAQMMATLAQARPGAVVLFTTACDQMRRAADAAPAPDGAPRFLFNLPATWQTPAARRLYHAELKRLGRFLETLGGGLPSDARLAGVIREHEAQRADLREHIRQSSARETARALAGYFDDARPALNGGGGIHPAEGVSLALIGGPLLPAQWPLFDTVESLGGCVVLNATEPGERCLLPPMPDPIADSRPFPRLADHYFDHAVDVFHRPNSRLYAWLGAHLAERQVRGLVLWVHLGCDLWRAEAASLREAFGLPLLVLEAHEVQAHGLRDVNRLAAFIESLQ